MVRVRMCATAALSAFVACVSIASVAYGQPARATLTIEVRFNSMPVADATVGVNGTTYVTDGEGRLAIPVTPGSIQITVLKDGFAPASTTVSVQAGQSQPILVDLQELVTVEEDVLVSATRTDKRLEDQPLRVEVLAREEIEEKMLMTPGDIVMMLN